MTDQEIIDKYEGNWKKISSCHVLPESFIDRHASEVKWSTICFHQKLSESFIEKHVALGNIFERQCWANTCLIQKLSEAFIKKHMDEVNWYYVCSRQVLSEEFMENNIDEINRLEKRTHERTNGMKYGCMIDYYLDTYYLRNISCPPLSKIKYMRKRGMIAVEGKNDILGYSERDEYLKKQDAKLKALDQLRELL